jgi:hypothetical protein
LPATLTPATINAYAKDKGFSGVALLVDESVHKAWIISTRMCDVHTDGNYINIYSYTAEDKVEQWEYIMGLPVVRETKEYPLSTLYSGVYEIDLQALAEGTENIISDYI